MSWVPTKVASDFIPLSILLTLPRYATDSVEGLYKRGKKKSCKSLSFRTCPTKKINMMLRKVVTKLTTEPSAYEF